MMSFYFYVTSATPMGTIFIDMQTLSLSLSFICTYFASDSIRAEKRREEVEDGFYCCYELF